MRLTRAQRAAVRSPQGQMRLLALVFAGAALFSLGTALSRGVFFERFVYEKFTPPAQSHLELSPVEMSRLSIEDRRALYGAFIDGTLDDAAPFLLHPAEFHGWLRGTVVTGSPAQRIRATRALPLLPGQLDEPARATATYALDRGVRLSDTELESAARAVLD